MVAKTRIPTEGSMMRRARRDRPEKEKAKTNRRTMITK